MYVPPAEPRFVVDIRDAFSPAITGFHGLKWFDPDLAFRVLARWIPYSPQKTITLATLVGTIYDHPVPGVAQFKIAAVTFPLEPALEDSPVAKLFFILRPHSYT